MPDAILSSDWWLRWNLPVMRRETVMRCRHRCGRMKRFVKLDGRENETGSVIAELFLHVPMRWRVPVFVNPPFLLG